MKHIEALFAERSAIRRALIVTALLHFIMRVILFAQQPDMGNAAVVVAAMITLLGILMA